MKSVSKERVFHDFKKGFETITFPKYGSHDEGILILQHRYLDVSDALAIIVVSKEQEALIRKTKNLLEELLETLDVMADRELMRDIAISKRQAKAGKRKSFRPLLEETSVAKKASRIHTKV